jgi:MoxR-like ATPase
MGVKINTKELLRLLEATQAEQNIMLVGRHGIGKSEIIEHFFRDRGERVVSLFLGQMSDPGDLIGLPSLDASQEKTAFRPPWWFPLDGKPVVLFLDELNRARPEILQSVMDLTLNKTLAGRKLPEGSRVISAVNEGEDYQLTDLDPALLSRFNVYRFAPSAGDWLDWAASKGLDERVLRFIHDNPDCLEEKAAQDNGLEKTADRRSWTRAAAIIAGVEHIDRFTEKILSGIVGVKAAVKFSQFHKGKSGVNGRAVMLFFESSKEELQNMTIHELSLLNEAMFRSLETEANKDTLSTCIRGLEKYYRFLSDGNKWESLAHMTSLFASSLYPRAKTAINGISPFLSLRLSEAAEDIDL